MGGGGVESTNRGLLTALNNQMTSGEDLQIKYTHISILVTKNQLALNDHGTKTISPK